MKTIELHYKGTLDNGEVFDSSYERNQPLKFEPGKGMLLSTFEEEALKLKKGEKSVFTIPKAYGDRIEEAVVDIPRNQFPPDFEVKVGSFVHGQGPDGRPLMALIVAENEDGSIKLDHNHKLAGLDLTFEIEIVSIEE